MNTHTFFAPARLLCSGLIVVLTACAPMVPEPSATAAAPKPLPMSAANEPAPTPTACPKEVPADARCLVGRDSKGAHIMVATPATWSGVLVLHARGGPALGAPKAERTVEDVQRWAVWVRGGMPWP